jgi:5S rRNA maturation endonuclease (ribonuclease M5)
MLSPESLEAIFEEVKDKTDVVVVVEGKRDAKALRPFGFENIIEISGKPLEDVAKKVMSSNAKNVAILTDFDDEGEDISSRLNNLFSHHHIKTDYIIRKKFMSLKIRKIEELNSFTKLMEDDYNGKIGPVYCKIFNRDRILSRRNRGKAGRHRGDIRPDRGSAGAGSGFKGAAKDWQDWKDRCRFGE